MKTVTLTNCEASGERVQATFSPEGGMNLLSFKRGHVEAIDQNTRHLYDERFAGLGALIGPHFHRAREPAEGFDKTLFPHLEHVSGNDPFSHGIARYAPWRWEATETQIEAKLSGSDEWHGIPLKILEGQDFTMSFSAKLVHDGLLINYAVKSEKPSVIGFHYYYAIEGKSQVEAMVEPEYRDVEEWKPMEERWAKGNKLRFPLEEEADFGFRPHQSPNEPFNRILLRTKSHLLHIDYCGNHDDVTSWQLYHPKGESFACIEPLTALNPRKPQYNETKLELKLSIFI